MFSKEALGLKIKTLRKARKITQEKFSEIIDVSPRHMVNIEMGYVYPSIEILEKIASVLEVSLCYFFDDGNSEKYYDKYELIKNRLHEKIDEISAQNLRLLYIIADNMN